MSYFKELTVITLTKPNAEPKFALAYKNLCTKGQSKNVFTTTNIQQYSKQLKFDFLYYDHGLEDFYPYWVTVVKTYPKAIYPEVYI